jgi:uncharacterized protein (DUF58 family)
MNLNINMSEETTTRDGLITGRNLGMRYRLALPREAMRGQNGVRLGTQAGSSLDFHDYRDYHLGDDLRHLDWNVYARSDKEIIKLFREEVSPRLDLVLDGSRSMHLQGTRKAEAALTLVAACSMAAENAHCSHGLWIAGQRVLELEGSRGDPALWKAPALDEGVSPEEGLLRFAPVWKRHGVRIFISDLLWPAEPLPIVRRLADGAASLTIIQLLAQEEERADVRGQHRFQDVETGDYLDVFVDASACAAYNAALARHREGWSTACRSMGATFVTITAEDLVKEGRLPALERCGLLE